MKNQWYSKALLPGNIFIGSWARRTREIYCPIAMSIHGWLVTREAITVRCIAMALGNVTLYWMGAGSIQAETIAIHFRLGLLLHKSSETKTLAI